MKIIKNDIDNNNTQRKASAHWGTWKEVYHHKVEDFVEICTYSKKGAVSLSLLTVDR